MSNDYRTQLKSDFFAFTNSLRDYHYNVSDALIKINQEIFRIRSIMKRNPELELLDNIMYCLDYQIIINMYTQLKKEIITKLREVKNEI